MDKHIHINISVCSHMHIYTRKTARGQKGDENGDIADTGNIGKIVDVMMLKCGEATELATLGLVADMMPHTFWPSNRAQSEVCVSMVL
jgi:hypothetical protein